MDLLEPGQYQQGCSNETITFSLNLKERNDFPLWTKEQIAKAKNRGSKPVFAYNTLTRKRTIYQSGAEFIKINKLPRSVVTKLLKANKLKEINNWYFVYFVDKPEFRIIEDKIFQLAGHVRDYIVLK